LSAAIITGAARGIGAACATTFAGAGWDVVLVDRDSSPLDEVESACGERAVTVVGDVAAADTNAAAVTLCEERFGALDAAVANAGVNLARSIDDTTDADIERLFSVNVNALIYLAQAAHPALARTSGSLVVMASKTGLVAQPDSPVYCATKGAAVLLARALALDWAAEGIRVNAVCPGIVLTDRTNTMPAAMLENFTARLPLPRGGEPGEAAQAYLYLMRGGYTTGQVLLVDGGGWIV